MPTNKNDKAVTIQRKWYSLSMNGKAGELTMYGEIVESQPRDWWTGEPIDGQFIVLKDFLADLEMLKGLKTLTIHLNSLGGDAYSSIAIHNRLRELQQNGTDITCNVDGAAMSGGSLIMCACDNVRVNPSSVVMIHDCWVWTVEQMNSGSLQKLAKELDVMDNSQAEIYARKSGQSLGEIRSMMDNTTYLSGREAVEYGFADEVIEDEKAPEISVSADHRTLNVNGHRMRIAAMGKLPENIHVVESDGNQEGEGTEEGIPTDAGDGTEPTGETTGGDNNPPELGENEGGLKTMTWDEFLAQNPEAAQAALAQARAEGVNAERQRLSAIDDVASCYADDIIRAAKYGENACTAQEMTYRAAVASAQQGAAFMRDLNADTKDGGAENVNPAPAAEEDPKVQSAEDLMAAGLAAARKLKEAKEDGSS